MTAPPRSVPFVRSGEGRTLGLEEVAALPLSVSLGLVVDGLASIRCGDSLRFLLVCLIDVDGNAAPVWLISEADRFLAPVLVARALLVVKSAITAFGVLVLRR